MNHLRRRAHAGPGDAPRSGPRRVRVTRIGGDIVLDPHFAGACVLVFDETAATALFDLLGEWLA